MSAGVKHAKFLKEQKIHFDGSLFERAMDFLNQHITQLITQHNQINQNPTQENTSTFVVDHAGIHWKHNLTQT